MAKKGSLNIVELHVEKACLGLAVLFTLGLAVYYLGLEPNKVEFDGRPLGPRELDEAVMQKAEDMDRAFTAAKPKAEPVPEYAVELKRQLAAGILTPLDPNTPPLPRTLLAMTPFGRAVKGISEGNEADSNIVPVTPLPPTALAARTGISVVRKKQLAVDPNATPTRASEDNDPVELSWVSIAGWFSLDGQQSEMTKANYAAYRSKPYLVGVDVQRQEMQASGEFGAWTDVEPGKADPHLDLQTPVYDDRTGNVVNQNELEAKFDLVKTQQHILMQPPFYEYESGDIWECPALAGLDADDDEPDEVAVVDKEKEKDKPKKGKDKEKEEARPNTPPGGGMPGMGGRGMPGGGGMPGMGGRGMPGGGGGGGMPGRGNPFGGGGGGVTPPGNNAESASKLITKALSEANKALREKHWADAIQKANSVVGNAEATKAQKSRAEAIVRDAQSGERREASRLNKAASGSQALAKLITNPDTKGETAVWFHDDSVTAGKTYRYRMRVKLWNRYVGRRDALAEPARPLADQPVLAGEWSLPSAPITVAPKQHFFVRGAAFNEPAATVEVFTWHKGKWLKQDFKVRVGDVIGNAVDLKVDEDSKKKETVDFCTNALVLDMRLDEPTMLRRAAGKQGEFAYRDTKSLVLVYLDPVDGQVKERVAEFDKSDPTYKRLKEEIDAG
jgi:hypothetical protein